MMMECAVTSKPVPMFGFAEKIQFECAAELQQLQTRGRLAFLATPSSTASLGKTLTPKKVTPYKKFTSLLAYNEEGSLATIEARAGQESMLASKMDNGDPIGSFSHVVTALLSFANNPKQILSPPPENNT